MTNEGMRDVGAAGQLIPLVEIQGEPVVRDVDIGEKLGFERPRKIRELIERYLPALEKFSSVNVRPAVGQTSGGRPTSEYWLSEKQALYVAARSGAANADAVLTMLIDVFVAWRRGHLAPAAVTVTDLAAEVRRQIGGIAKSVMHAEIAEVLPQMVERTLLESGHVVSTDFKPALDVLLERKVPSTKRRAFSQKISYRLRRFSLERGLPFRLSRETGRYLFHVDTITLWLAAEGDAMIRDHVATVSGQPRLALVGGKRA